MLTNLYLVQFQEPSATSNMQSPTYISKTILKKNENIANYDETIVGYKNTSPKIIREIAGKWPRPQI